MKIAKNKTLTTVLTVLITLAIISSVIFSLLPRHNESAEAVQVTLAVPSPTPNPITPEVIELLARGEQPLTKFIKITDNEMPNMAQPQNGRAVI